MPHSRKRHGHHEYKKTADIPSRQRTNGKLMWAVLFGVFGFLISFFAAGFNYTVLLSGSLVAAFIGLIIGRKMEQAARSK